MTGRRIARVRMVADPYPPYQYEEEGRIRGVDQEIVTEAFRVHGIAVETRLLPWKQCLAWLDSGEVDGVFQILPSPEREKLYLFSDLLRSERTVVYQRAGGTRAQPAGGGGPDPFRGRRLGILEGYSYGPEVDRRPQSQKTEYRSPQELLQALGAGEIELILMDAGLATHLARALGLQGIEQVPGYEITRPLHAAFRRDGADLVDLFNSGLAAVRQQGIYDRILSAYGLSA